MAGCEYSFLYKVRNEKNFLEIAEEFQLSEVVLRAMNPKIRQVRPGIELKIPIAECPNGAFHTLKEGEGLFHLAVGIGSTAEDILAANPGLAPGRALPGQTVILPEQERATRTYRICGTDHLWDILRKFEMSVPTLRRLNPGLDIFSLREGQEIVVMEYAPVSDAEGIYTLKAGETLLSLCEKNGFSPAELLRANPNLCPQDFAKGMRIVLPQKKDRHNM